MKKGGLPVLPVMGEMHYNRTDSRYWRDVLLKTRASGVDIVSTYCLWSLHEEFEGTLSWEDRLNGNAGYLFCSNYLYGHDRKDYDDVRFNVKLDGETVSIPRKGVKVCNGAYFLWPFNQYMADICLKYSTTQPVCSLQEGDDHSFFFFEDDDIPGEYLISDFGIKHIEVQNGILKKEKNGYFVNRLVAGKECVIKIIRETGPTVRFFTLTEEDSDNLWKGKVQGKEFIGISHASLFFDRNEIVLIEDSPSAEIWIYEKEKFKLHTFRTPFRHLEASIRSIAPLEYSQWISPSVGEGVKRQYSLNTFSMVKQAWLRYVSADSTYCTLNGKKVDAKMVGGYNRADITKLIQRGSNTIEFSNSRNGVVAEVEICLSNGERIVWNTDATWLSASQNIPVCLLAGLRKPLSFAPEEHVALYEVNAPVPVCGDEETRIYISYKGDVGSAYLNGKLVADNFYNGTDWIISLNRLNGGIDATPLVLRIGGLKSADANIFFEKGVNPAECVEPMVSGIRVTREYRFIHGKNRRL